MERGACVPNNGWIVLSGLLHMMDRMMEPALTLTFRGVERNGAIEARIRDIGGRLRRCNRRITRCHVTVLGGGGQVREVRIQVSAPGAEVHAESSRRDGRSHTDVFEALREAYESARGQLQELDRGGGRPGLLSGVRAAAVRAGSRAQMPESATPPLDADP